MPEMSIGGLKIKGDKMKKLIYCLMFIALSVMLLTPVAGRVVPIEIAESNVIDLSRGGSIDLLVFHSERACTIDSITLIYTEGTSSDTGVTIRVGRETDDNYYYTGTSATSEPQWTTANLTLLKTDIAVSDTLTFGKATDKTGAGEMQIIVYYTID